MDQLVRDDNRASAGANVLHGESRPPPAPLTQRELRAIIVSLMLAMFLAALDQTIVATALPTIGHQFLDVSNLSWVITAYLVASTAMSPVFGTLSDIYGRRVMIAIALSLFIAGSVLCALAPSLIVLILARALQGFGGGGILPVVQTIVADVIAPRERGQYQAYFSAVWASAGIGGPILGGVMTQYLDWSLIFWINLPLGVAALAVLLPKMNRIPQHHRHRRLDWIGGLLLMTAAVVVLLVLTWGGSRLAWRSPEILSMIAVAVALTGVFVWHARRTAEPFLPLAWMGGTVVPFAITLGALAIGAMIALTVYLPLYYEVVYGLPASQAGLALIPLVAVSVAGASAAGRVMSRMRHYKWAAIVGTGIAAVLFAAMAVFAPMPLWLFLSLLSLASLGLGTGFPTSTVSVQNAVARHQVGTVTGAANFFRSLMSSFAVAAFTAMLLAALGAHVAITGRGLDITHDLAAPETVAAFRLIFVAAAVMMATAALAAALMEERPLAGPPGAPTLPTD